MVKFEKLYSRASKLMPDFVNKSPADIQIVAFDYACNKHGEVAFSILPHFSKNM
jgi:hypothetical protein